MPTTDPTPIPGEALEAAAKWFSHWMGASSVRKRDREYAAEVLATAAPILLAAGRTRSGCCQAAVDSDGHTHAETCVYLLGLREGRAEGRTAAAAAIRDAAYPDPSPCIPAWHAGYTEAWERAARVAENGADHV